MDYYGEISGDIVRIICRGGIGVLATDTLYGLVGSALDEASVERIYEVRQRDLEKPMIILISSWDDLKIFDVALGEQEKKKISLFWPGKVSVILPCPHKKWEYLHRGTESLAFRWPKKSILEELIKKTGPLVAPSANMAGAVPAKTIKGARQYFRNNVDFYADEGAVVSEPSTIVSFKGEKFIIERDGTVDAAALIDKM